LERSAQYIQNQIKKISTLPKQKSEGTEVTKDGWVLPSAESTVSEERLKQSLAVLKELQHEIQKVRKSKQERVNQLE